MAKKRTRHSCIKRGNVWLLFDRWISGGLGTQLLVALIIFTIGFVVVATIYVIKYKCYGWAAAFVDMADPSSMHKAAYNNIVDHDVNENNLFPSGFLILVYMIGTIVLSGVLIATLINFYRTRADKFKHGDVSYRFKNHVVFLGYDDLMVGMIEKICKEKNNKIRILVAVSSDVPGACLKIRNRLTEEERKCVVIIQADSCNCDDLEKRIRVNLAHSVYIIGENTDSTHDAINLECFSLIRRIYEKCKEGKEHGKDKRYRMPDCYVNLEHQSAFAMFQTYAGSHDNQAYAHFHPFNFEEEWARIMIMGEMAGYNQMLIDSRGEAESISKQPDRQVHLVIAGMTEMGEALAREAAFLCHYRSFVDNGIRTKITFVDKNAKENMNYFIGRYHRLFEECKYSYQKLPYGHESYNENSFLDMEFEFVETNIADPNMVEKLKQWASDTKQMLTIAICFDAPHKNLAAALYLPDIIFEQSIPVWVYQPARGDLGKYLEKDIKVDWGNGEMQMIAGKLKNIITFGADGRMLLGEDYRKGIENAKKLNCFYSTGCNVNTDYDSDDAKKTIEEEWGKLSVAKRWSNYYNISAISVKLRSVGLAKGDDIPNDMIDVLATVEHNRWNMEKLLMGYRPTTRGEHELWSTDEHELKAKLVHDHIRPYKDLDEKTKKKYKNYTREIPKIIKDKTNK